MQRLTFITFTVSEKIKMLKFLPCPSAAQPARRPAGQLWSLRTHIIMFTSHRAKVQSTIPGTTGLLCSRTASNSVKFITWLLFKYLHLKIFLFILLLFDRSWFSVHPFVLVSQSWLRLLSVTRSHMQCVKWECSWLRLTLFHYDETIPTFLFKTTQ